MSGGSFNGNQYYLHDIADQIDVEIDKRKESHVNYYGDTVQAYPEEILDIMRKTRDELIKLVPVITAIDYLIADDYGPESFLDKIKSLEKE
jgi:hypothetical protein